MKKTNDYNEPNEFSVGDIIIFEECEWKVAEIDGSRITLYRDRIDGSPETIRLQSKDLQGTLKR